MQKETASRLANDWLDEYGADRPNWNEVKVIAQRTLETLVPDGAADVLGGDDGNEATVAVVADGRLFRVRGEVHTGQPRGVLEVDHLKGARFSVTQEWVQGAMGEQFVRRGWTLTLSDGRSFSFYSSGPRDVGHSPFVVALAEAAGWALPE